MPAPVLRFLQAAAILMGGLALYVAVGWAVGDESMVRILPSSAAMPLNTAIMFLASAVCLWPLPECSSSSYRLFLRGRVAAACMVVALSGAMLAEQSFALDLGIDWPSLHSQVNDGNPFPGRSAPNACLGFLLAGAAFLALARDKADFTRGRLADLLVFATLLVGVSALLINALNLEALYAVAAYHRMATLSAYGLTLLGLGLWLQLQAQSRSAESRVNPDQRIVRTAIVVLSVVVVSAGLGGFAVLKQGFEETMSAALLRTTVNSSMAFQSIIDQRIVLGRTIAERPRLQMLLATLSANPHDPQALALAREVGQSLLSSGISGLRMSNAQGDPLAVLGNNLDHPAEMEVPVQGNGQIATMLWRDGFVLRTTNAIHRDGTFVGTLIAEQRLTDMTALLRSADAESASTDLLVCGRKADEAVCFPSRFYKVNLHIPMYKDGQPYLAISRALLGQKGVLFVKDLRGLTVFAGYAPLGQSGLGMVFKTDSIDLFAPIRQRLNGFVGLLLVLVAAGTLLLRAQIQPLARKLVSEQQRSAAILESSHEAFIEMDKHGVVQDWNREAELTFGWTRAEAVGQDLADLIIPSPQRDAHRYGMARFNAGREWPVLGKRIELLALHRSGASIMIEITISAIKDNDEYRFTAFMHDIAERKQAEADLLAAKHAAVESEQFARATIDTVPETICVLDRSGVIIAVNQSWRDFYDANFDDPQSINYGLGTSYLQVCESATGAAGSEAPLMAQGLTAVLAGERDLFSLEYPCDSPTEKRFFCARVKRFPGDSGHVLVAHGNITERKMLELELARMAQTDVLTDLNNRRHFIQLSETELSRTSRYGGVLSVIMLDIDHFKCINDTHGHQVGDTVIQMLAEVCRAQLRDLDVIGRLGGEEFAVTMPNADHAQAMQVAERLRLAIEAASVALPQGLPLRFTASIGVTTLANDPSNLGTLLDQADQALYKAKNNGRNQVRSFIL